MLFLSNTVVKSPKKHENSAPKNVPPKTSVFLLFLAMTKPNAKNIAEKTASIFPNDLLSASPSLIIIETPIKAISMDIQTTLWGFSLIQNQPIQPAKIGDIESRNNVDAIDVLSIEKTYVKNAKEKQMPIKKSFLSKLFSTLKGGLFLLTHTKVSMTKLIPIER